MKGPIRIAHISDLHFSKICLNPFQIFSKRILGNANLLLKRGRIYLNEKPFSLPDLFIEKGVTDVFISGDLTTTSQKSEYKLARTFIAKLQEKGLRVTAIPGNHDHYTSGAVRRRAFYQEMPKEVCNNSFALGDHFWVVALDTSMYTPFVDATGDFTIEIEEQLRKTLREIPAGRKVFLLNHFPFFNNDKHKRRLIGGDRLAQLLRKTPNVLFYLHGHTHRRTLVDLRADNLPIVLDSGSVSHAHHGSWNLLDLSKNKAHVEVFESKDRHGNIWTCVQREIFSYE
ncbi:MAG: metallophosphoesterase [Chlamydiales bacterium]